MASRPPLAAARPTLRPAKPSDGAAVARLLGELGYECTREEAVDRIMTVAEDPSQALLLAELHGEACGLLALDFMYFVPLGRTTCRITTLIDLCSEPDALSHPKGTQIRISRQEISRIVGCSREMVGRVLKNLEEQHLISVSGKTIVVLGTR